MLRLMMTILISRHLEIQNGRHNMVFQICNTYWVLERLKCEINHFGRHVILESITAVNSCFILRYVELNNDI